MSFTADERLMLLAARSEPAEDACRAIRALVAEPLDWERFVETSVRHGVAPLAHRGLGIALGDDLRAIPAGPRAQLTRLAATSATRSARLLDVLAAILDELGSRGIRPLGLKDLGLAFEVFPQLGLRPLGDLDLLIEREQYDEVARAMTELGFEALVPRGATFTLTHGWGHHFRRERDNVWIDIQWNVLQREWDEPGAGRRSFDPAILREGAYDVALPAPAAPPLLVGSREATLFHLCSHLEGHEYGELILFCDIAESLQRQRDELDWDRVLAIARRFEALATVGHVLGLTRRLLGAPVPDDVTRACERDTFRGAVHPAIFGGLGALHYSLDDVQATIAPPPPLLRRLEAGVRHQAAAARALYDEVDAILGDFDASGGELMALGSSGSGRRFPDTRIEPFGVVELVVLEHDAQRLHAVLGARGYEPAEDGAVARSVDVQGAPLGVRVRERDARALFEAPARPMTNRETARQSLTRRLRRGATAAADASARIDVIAVDRTDLLVWLLAGLGERRHEALYGMPPLLDVLRTLTERPDAVAVVARAETLAITPAVRRGVALAAAVAGDDPLIGELDGLLGSGGGGVASAFEWAREGPDVEQAQKALRDAYLLALCAMQARPAELRSLLGRIARGRDGGRAPLVTIAGGALRGVAGIVRPSTRPPGVYWLEG